MNPCKNSSKKDLEVDRVSHTVRRKIHIIDLSPKEFALLEFLMRHEGLPVSRTPTIFAARWISNTTGP